jgi:hypothetical protein
MRLNTSLTLLLLCVLGTAAEGQDRRDWQSLAQLQAGDKIRLSLKTGPVDGAFQNWTPQQVTAGAVIARREEVLKIERYRQGGLGRGKAAAVGALIGFGGGFAVGAGAVRLSAGPIWPLHLARSRGRGGRRRGRLGRRRDWGTASPAQQGADLFGQIRMLGRRRRRVSRRRRYGRSVQGHGQPFDTSGRAQSDGPGDRCESGLALDSTGLLRNSSSRRPPANFDLSTATHPLRRWSS